MSGLRLVFAGATASIACGFPTYELRDKQQGVSGSSLGGAAGGGPGGNQAGGNNSFAGDAVAAGASGAPAGGPPTRGCSDKMLACLRMDDNPEQHGWLASQSGDASSQIIEGYPGNNVLKFTTVGSEAAPGPVAAFSWTSPAAIGSGTLLFDFRLDDLGPYTRAVIAEVDLGPRALRFLVQTQPRKTLILQWVTSDLTVLEERDVPEPSFFQQTRLLRLDYSLGIDPKATAFVEGKSVAEAPLGNDWVAAPPRVTFGAVDYLFPTSGAQFELDNLGFDAP